jgi:hypothetical protein
MTHLIHFLAILLGVCRGESIGLDGCCQQIGCIAQVARHRFRFPDARWKWRNVSDFLEVTPGFAPLIRQRAGRRAMAGIATQHCLWQEHD